MQKMLCCKLNISLSTGYVALVVGGFDSSSVELYSPTGTCNHILTPVPAPGVKNPVLVYANEMIIACQGGVGCWEYDTFQNNWTVISTAPFATNFQQGTVFQSKLFVHDAKNPQVLDLDSSTWSSWPSPPVDPGLSPCVVPWEDNILIFGGYDNLQGVQMFNHASQTWAILEESQAPMEMLWTSAVELTNDNFLLVGSEMVSAYYTAVIYNPLTKTWTQLEDMAVKRRGTRLVALGSRYFAMEGFRTNNIDEFDLDTNTWQLMEPRFQVQRRGYHSVLALPADLFSHLPEGCVGVE
jgi:hypothetical protein